MIYAMQDMRSVSLSCSSDEVQCPLYRGRQLTKQNKVDEKKFMHFLLKPQLSECRANMALRNLVSNL